jgi:trigger factor
VKTEIKDLKQLRKEIIVSFDAKDVKAAEATIVKEFMNRAKVPGFRPGKAPEAIVVKNYTKEISEELQREIITRAYNDGLKQTGLDIYGIVKVDPATIARNEPCVVKIEVDVNPEIALPAYDSIDVKIKVEPVKEEEVDQMITHIRNQKATFTKVERAAKVGDYVKLNYIGKVDGKRVDELDTVTPIYGTQMSTWEEAGSKESPGVKAIVDGIVGLKAGDTKSVTQQFDAQFEVKALAGKKVDYALDILEVHERQLPEMNEEFFKTIEVKNEEELRDQIRGNLKKRHERDADGQKRKQIMDHLKKGSQFDLPEMAVVEATEAILRNKVMHAYQHGTPDAEIMSRRDQLAQEAADEAKERVKLELILKAVAKKENLQITNEEFGQAVYAEAMWSRQSPDKIVAELKKNPAFRNSLKDQVLYNKTLDFIAEKVKVTEAK